MSDLLNALSQSASGMAAQSSRLRHISENIANVDTPGYRRKTVSFEEMADGSGVEAMPAKFDRSERPKIYDPGHPMADKEGFYQGSNVDLPVEMADARQAQRSYEANLSMFDQARQMTRNVLDLLRR